MKWLAIVSVCLAGVVIGYLIYAAVIANPRVAAELRRSAQTDLADRVMLLTLPTGRTIPVNYLREGDKVYAGADGPWWRAFRGEGARATLLIKGETLEGHAIAVEDDPEHTRDVFSRLRPTVPSWLPGWLDATLVEVRLD